MAHRKSDGRDADEAKEALDGLVAACGNAARILCDLRTGIWVNTSRASIFL